MAGPSRCDTKGKWQMKKLRHIAFWPPVVIFVGAVIVNLAAPDAFTAALTAANGWIVSNFAWAFVIGVIAALVVVIWAMVSKFGNVRIGGRAAAPILSKPQYFIITLTTIIAVGILFWGTSEPLYHYLEPPESLDVDPSTPQAAVFALSTMFIHWGFLPVAIYAVPAAMFAFAFYNMRKPYTIASTIVPVFGNKILGRWSQGLDAIVMYSLVAGMAASLGSGILSVSGGLSYLTGWQSGLLMWGLVDIAVVVAFVVSSAVGLFRGIKRLSEINFLVFIALLAFVFIFGPTVFMLNIGTEAFADSIATFLPKAAFTGAAAGDTWAGAWTIFYWCNWLSWAPISGMFLGRISYGYTVREMLTYQFVLPAAFDIIWICFFSSTAIWIERESGGDMANALAVGPEFAATTVFEHLPLAFITIPLFVAAVFISYVSGADAYTTTLGGLSTTGISPESPEPPLPLKIFWGVLLGAVSWMLLGAAGIDGIKMMSNVAGLPALILLCFIMVSLVKVGRNPSQYDVNKADYDEHGRPIPSRTKKATMKELAG